MIGKSGAEIVEFSRFADEKIVVDRVKLRDGKKAESIREILKITKDVRRRKFDFVVDLHSLYETNLLGFFSGAKHRLYANRENRSLDFLANFTPKPPLEDKKLHLTDHYLNLLKPLGIENAPRFIHLKPRVEDAAKIESLFSDFQNKKLVGLFPGAGNVSRRWHLEKFAALAENIAADETLQAIIFLGPEEADLRRSIEKIFPENSQIIDRLSLLEFVAALSKLAVLVSNDTGAIHLSALVETPIVLVMDKRAPQTYLPLIEKIKVVNDATIDEIKVETVWNAAQEILGKI